MFWAQSTSRPPSAPLRMGMMVAPQRSVPEGLRGVGSSVSEATRGRRRVGDSMATSARAALEVQVK